ncbi:hypothetical protein WN944_012885 [Citrus x changshan-huyou]|uniref:DUF3593 domain-containing protein n=1 Tax=Citrus x changshan-huyou TaxID=2935761 RepID=A0AAP0M433_9ROSI
MVAITRLQTATTGTATALGSFPLLQYPQIITNRPCRLIDQDFKSNRERRIIGNGKIKMRRRTNTVACGWLLPVDPWAPNMSIDSQSIASQLFALSLFPYLGFLYFITKSNSAPKLTLFGFYFLLAFVGATTKVNYGTSLSNVDWLHGGAESLLTLTNIFIVLGLRQALRKAKDAK